MTLKELIEKCKGPARFDVNNIVDDSPADVVVFMAEEAGAIKDSILDAEVSKFRVSGIYDGIPTISVLVRETAASPEPPAGGDTEGGGDTGGEA